jgi:hypothetical protein
MKRIVIAGIICLLPTTAAAMDLTTFLAKKNGVMRKGPFGLLSGDYKLITAELTNSNKALRAERLAALQAGDRPAYCPPQKNNLPPPKLFARLESIPAGQRPNLQLKDALRIVYAREWPCPTK